MKIVVDIHIPFVADAVRRGWPNVDICPMEPEQIDASAVRDADVLIVRTRTKVNEALLEGSSVRLVCTATIGFDHIDTAWCDAHDVRWMSCPGCNAQAVCDYIEQALVESPIANHQSPITIGVVGVGHVGSLVAKMAERKGYKVLLNDPPKGIGVSLDSIAQKCDIITFHVPLDKTTFRLCDEAFLNECKPGALIINAARGGVVDEQALLRSGHPYVIDTWENEPELSPRVLEHAFRASMHIAGYSLEGKRNASQMCLDAVAAQFALPKISLPPLPVRPSALPGHWLADITEQLKAQPGEFEQLRKNYPLR
jgi:erythronate-4-phosphate dehydrogenase